MKLTDGVEWSIHCASVLATLPEGKTLSGKALAEYHGVSESYLLKHLKAMVKAGLVASISGPKGGFRLAKPAVEITFLDVVRAVEGPEPAFRCTEIRQRGPLAADAKACHKPCAIKFKMLQAEKVWRDALKEQTIGSLGAELTEILTPERIAEGERWLEVNAR